MMAHRAKSKALFRLTEFDDFRVEVLEAFYCEKDRGRGSGCLSQINTCVNTLKLQETAPTGER